MQIHLNQVVIQQTATLTWLVIDNTPASIEVSGSIGTIAMTAGGNLVTDDLTTTGGITVSGGDGIIEINFVDCPLVVPYQLLDRMATSTSTTVMPQTSLVEW